MLLVVDQLPEPAVDEVAEGEFTVTGCNTTRTTAVADGAVAMQMPPAAFVSRSVRAASDVYHHLPLFRAAPATRDVEGFTGVGLRVVDRWPEEPG